MMNKRDLEHKDYPRRESSEVAPEPGSRPPPGPFDNRSGEEVLALANRFISRYGLVGPEYIGKIEEMLHDYLPSDITCRREAFIWLRDHWSDYDRQTVNNEQLTMNNGVIRSQEPADVKPGKREKDSKIIYEIAGSTG